MGNRTAQRRRLTTLVGALILASAYTAGNAQMSAAAPACATVADEAALNTRVLQTELMVAALSCGEQQRYNAFVTTFKNDLIRGGQGLKTMFKRVYGASGDYQMNAFVTRLANNAAQRTASGPDAYCATSASLFNEVLATSPGHLARITTRPELSSLHGFGRCRS